MTYPVASFVRDEMEERGMDLDALVAASGVDRDALVGVLDDCDELTQPVAEGLGRAFGSSAQFWLNLDEMFWAALGLKLRGMP